MTTTRATEEFKRLAAIAGGTRDWDIAGDLLKAAQKSRASMGLLVAAAQEMRALAVIQSQTIKSDEVERFLNDMLLRAQAALASSSDDIPLRDFAENRVRRAHHALKKRSKEASRHETVQQEALHDVRKAGKKLRDLLEFFQPFINGKRKRTFDELTSVQNKLGQFNVPVELL